jgi:hypothetical protein
MRTAGAADLRLRGQTRGGRGGSPSERRLAEFLAAHGTSLNLCPFGNWAGSNRIQNGANRSAGLALRQMRGYGLRRLFEWREGA